jgi:diaminopimelate epimerase
MRFTKMQGAGNDYIYVDCFRDEVPENPTRLAVAMADRHFGIGGDGLILICPADNADAEMRMFNADGSYSQMCGNGIRCVAKYLYDHGICERPTLRIASGGRVLELNLEIVNRKVERVSVDMGEPIFEPASIPTRLPGTPPVDVELPIEGMELSGTVLSMGNPHCVVYRSSLSDYEVHTVGPRIEVHPVFPERVNAEFVEVISSTRVKQRTWERGSGETMACGTGASAVCVAGVLTGRTERRLHVELLGGELELEWSEATNRVTMTGPAVEVFSGEWPA